MMKLPQARTADILEQEAGDELLIYDLRTNRMFQLNETSRIIFKACDGATSFDELKRASKFTDDLIYLALGELKKNNLIEDNYASPLAGMNRREAVKRVGLASMIALPLISAIIAPPAAHAASRRCACCVRAGQLICATCGRTGIIQFAGYNSRNGTCTNPDGGIGSIDCSGTDGTDTREVCVL